MKKKHVRFLRFVRCACVAVALLLLCVVVVVDTDWLMLLRRDVVQNLPTGNKKPLLIFLNIFLTRRNG